MNLRKGDTVKIKGNKLQYLITKVKGEMVHFITLNGQLTGSFNRHFVKLKRIS